MNWLRIIGCFGFLLGFSQCASPAKEPEKIAGIKVPTEWIEKVRPCDRQDTLLLLKQFEGFIAPDTLDGSSEKVHYKGILNDQPPGVLMPKFVNLDDDPAEELIGLFGYFRRENPTLAVFKLIGNSWYMLYHESFYDFYSSAELKVANGYSPNKLFYVNCVYGRGSGAYIDAYRFFKLIDNKVYSCLELTKEKSMYAGGQYLNEDDSTTFRIDSTTADRITASYSYNYFFADDYGTPKSKQIAISLAKGEKTVDYLWDKARFRYQPHFKTGPGEMTQEKIECIRSRFSNDSLFIRAFAHEIKEAFKSATPEQRIVLQKYLASAGK